MTIHKNGENQEMEIISNKSCPNCDYPKVTSMCIGKLPDAEMFVAWCPCGTIFTEKGIVQNLLVKPRSGWWKIK